MLRSSPRLFRASGRFHHGSGGWCRVISRRRRPPPVPSRCVYTPLVTLNSSPVSDRLSKTLPPPCMYSSALTSSLLMGGRGVHGRSACPPSCRPALGICPAIPTVTPTPKQTPCHGPFRPHPPLSGATTFASDLCSTRILGQV